MISSFLQALFYAFGFIIFLLGVQSILFFPLTLVYEWRKRRRLRALAPFTGLVSVIVPAYNEEKTIRATVESILRSDYGPMELIVVNDGSTDGTAHAIRDFIDGGKIVYIAKRNGGKASALNEGIAAAKGEVVIFSDADSFFRKDTVPKMARWFDDPSIDAVCGNDAPLNPATAIQKFLAVTTHIGTGFVRRALSVMGCLPIITGNLGAVRTSALREAGGFRELWGEDLELTFRLHKMEKRIIFDPEPEVIAECPGTVRSLWKQRVRWLRSYIKISVIHRDLFFKWRYRPFSLYLPVNFLNMTIVPLLQLVLLCLIPWALATDHLYFETAFDVLTYLGLVFFLVIALYSILLDGDLQDLVYLPYGLLILPFSYFYNAVALYSWGKELGGATETWEKIERRPVMETSPRPVNRWKLAVAALVLVALSSAGTYAVMTRLNLTTGGTSQQRQAVFDLGLSTHFDAWGDWRDAVKKVLDRPNIGMARVIGVGAGRPEWVYFKWLDHDIAWANHQRGARTDLLLGATRTFRKEGLKVAAIVDLYAPKYLAQHKEAAAVRSDGFTSPEQVGLVELVDGEYGKLALSMIDYLSKNYPIDIVNLTELSYYDFSFSADDLASFRRMTGRKAWPRDRKGAINKDDPAVWEWKSAMMERFLAKAAELIHQNGKEFYVDVPVSWKDFRRNGRESGLDYTRVLKHADKIIVWNYYYLEDLPPTVSEDLTRYLVANFPPSRFYVSIGLWGKKEHVDAASFKTAVQSTLRGGATQIWVTPNDLVSPGHWDGMLPFWKGELL